MHDSRSDRNAIIQSYNQKNVPVLIIGGGINGLGTFRELALNGVDVLLVERGDFCSGTSAASSHMVHGGIRYLENGEFRLVREAVRERNRLINNAPHYVKPLPTVIPIFKTLSGLFNAPLKFLDLTDKPAERGAAVIKAGLVMYDGYTGGDKTVPKHKFRRKRKSLKAFPKLNKELIATAVYYDAAMTTPERIGLEVMLDGESANENAHALNYVSAVGAEGGSVILRDEVSGETVSVIPEIVINAAGPWIDFVNAGVSKKSPKMIGGTKGSHIVLENDGLYAACQGHEVFFENDDGRIVLIYPLQGKVLVGTSDIRIDDPDQAVCTEEEIGYFLEFVRDMFPTVAVDESQIQYTFSGVRPLPASDEGSTGQISRDHVTKIVEPTAERPFAVLNLIGGKWTTFRAFSEQTAEKVLYRLGKVQTVSTKTRPLIGAVDYPSTDSERETWVDTLAETYSLDHAQAEDLFERYGTYAKRVAEFISAGEDTALVSAPDFSVRELTFLAQNEKVVHLGDMLQRRTLIAMLGRLNREIVQEFGEVCGEALGWDSARKDTETAEFTKIASEKHLVSFT